MEDSWVYAHVTKLTKLGKSASYALWWIGKMSCHCSTGLSVIGNWSGMDLKRLNTVHLLYYAHYVGVFYCKCGGSMCFLQPRTTAAKKNGWPLMVAAASWQDSLQHDEMILVRIHTTWHWYEISALNCPPSRCSSLSYHTHLCRKSDQPSGRSQPPLLITRPRDPLHFRSRVHYLVRSHRVHD